MQIIASEQELDRFAAKAEKQNFLACDTEFVRVRTYYPDLALIQIAAGDEVALIDPLLVKDFTSLKRLFENKDIVKVFHAPRQDLELLRHSLGFRPQRIFDTQIAASLLGFPDQIGYEALTREILEIQLDKSAQFTDWLNRPLTDEQLVYAQADVTHLASIYTTCLERLGERAAWADDLCALYDSDGLYEIDLRPAFAKWAPRLKRDDQRARLWIALHWRESRAQKINRPRLWILKDAAMLSIVKGESEKVPPGLNRAFEKDMEKAVLMADETFKAMLKPLNMTQKTALNEIKLKANFIAAEHAVPLRFLAHKTQLENYARSGAVPEMMTSWQKTLFWDKLGGENACATSS